MEFSIAAERLLMLGLADVRLDNEVRVSRPGIETVVADGKHGTVLTLINWTNKPLRGVKVEVRMPKAPREVYAVHLGKALAWKYVNGRVTFTTDVADADFILLRQ